MPAVIAPTDLKVGTPQISGPLTVHPLFRGDAPGLEYRSFAQAAAEGFVVHEVEHGGAVNDLVVTNPLDVAVMLYDGEEVMGAQQNRTLDTTVLVPAHAQLTVPVSCVEQGRWEGERNAEGFVPAPQAAYPSLRRMKSAQATAAAARGGLRRADQGAVWAEVGAMAERRDAPTATGAMHDVYEHDRASLAEIANGIERADGQVGAVAVIGGRVAVLDYVSRSDVWAALHGPLVQGYALDALDNNSRGVPLHPGELVDQAWVQGWASTMFGIRDVLLRPTVGLGRSIAIDACGTAATGCVHDGELVQMTAFPGYDEPVADATRIRRPSRRR
ncbi:hypothetical protein DSM112329_04783 [Paraconexibacter sp. AEG42_29]|uniref:ARG and Rhodanese-Phosphatase-superfamily-associated domain-containing protein n=1 Tax=Paraconexibacter sp. AEG42_29 TaxID=2997339 RepID=A0AAU7B203_9ACTN